MLQRYLLGASATILSLGVSFAYAAAQTPHVHETAVATPCTTIAEPDCSIEDFLLSVMHTRGVSAAMASLDSLAASDENIQRDGHAAKPSGDLGRSIRLLV